MISFGVLESMKFSRGLDSTKEKFDQMRVTPEFNTI